MRVCTIQGTHAKKLFNCRWRDFINRVRQEEEPIVFSFSHTHLGMNRTLGKHRAETAGSGAYDVVGTGSPLK